MTTIPQMRHALSKILGDQNITSEIDSPEPCKIVYLYGGENHKPSLVAWPTSTEQVSEVMKLATREKIPVVPWGGGTGRYSGGIVAPDGALVISTQKLNRIISVDAASRTALVESGVTVLQLNRDLDKVGLWWPHDPESKKYATIGGSISVNGIGTYASKFGSATRSVLELKIVLADGSIVKVGSQVSQSLIGYDLVSLFTRAEGTLGVITEVAVRLEKRPETRQFKIFEFESMASAVEGCTEILDAGLVPDTLIIEDFTRFYNTITGFDPILEGKVNSATKDHQALLIVSFSGSKKSTDSSMSETTEICRGVGAAPIEDKSITQAWWVAKTEHLPVLPKAAATLKNIPMRAGIADLAVPLSTFPTVYEEFKSSILELNFIPRGARCYVTLLREAIMSLGVAFDESKSEEKSKYINWLSRMSRSAIGRGGTMSCMTGSALKLVEQAEDELGSAWPLTTRIKACLDPDNILNRGKKFRLYDQDSKPEEKFG